MTGPTERRTFADSFALAPMTEDQLRVAALCGHPGAHHAVVGGEVPSNPVELVMALKGFGPKVYVRAAVAALESARPVTGESEKKRLDVVPLLKQWLESPSGGLADQIKGKGGRTARKVTHPPLGK